MFDDVRDFVHILSRTNLTQFGSRLICKKLGKIRHGNHTWKKLIRFLREKRFDVVGSNCDTVLFIHSKLKRNLLTDVSHLGNNRKLIGQMSSNKRNNVLKQTETN